MRKIVVRAIAALTVVGVSYLGGSALAQASQAIPTSGQSVASVQYAIKNLQRQHDQLQAAYDKKDVEGIRAVVAPLSGTLHLLRHQAQRMSWQPDILKAIDKAQQQDNELSVKLPLPPLPPVGLPPLPAIPDPLSAVLDLVKALLTTVTGLLSGLLGAGLPIPHL